MFEKMTHANFRLPKPTEFPARHPFRNEKNHQKLLEYLQQRLMLGKNARDERSEEHTSELQSLMRISYAVFCLKKKNKQSEKITKHHIQETHTYKHHK